MHRNKSGKLGFDLLDYHFRAAGHDRNPRPATFLVDFSDRKALYIVTTAGKQANDSGQDTWLVIDKHGYGMAFGSI